MKILTGPDNYILVPIYNQKMPYAGGRINMTLNRSLT